MELGDLNIICTDLAQSLRFYVDALGFELLERQEMFAHLQLGTRRITLLAVAEEPSLPARYCQRPTLSVDLMTDDLAAELRRLRASGVAPLADPAANAKRAFIADPDGLVMELIQR